MVSMVKIDRFAAWVLFVVMILYAISGYGMTKGIIDPSFARAMHLSWLGAIGLVAFVTHTGWAIHLAFRRWQIWNLGTKMLLMLFYAAMVCGLFYVHFFYQPGSVKNINTAAQSAAPANASEMIFTAQTLAKYNGQNGQPAYVAVDGLVYDLSTVFRGGVHAGYAAGKDLSAEFYSRHSADTLNGYKVVGKFQAQ
jgi:predicted heme/steroid binding protein